MKSALTHLISRSALGVALGLSSAASLFAVSQLPASSKPPFVVPDGNNLWTTISLLSTGDAAPNGYRMVGIPDGMGLFDNGDGTFTVLMNHELGRTSGVTRAHGTTGAFVSKWVFRKDTLAVVAGADLIQRVKFYDKALGTWRDAVGAERSFDRFCSADLPAVSAFFNATTGKGTQNRIYLNGEETGNEGRAMAHIVTGPDAGTSYDWPHAGKASWENSLACPFPQDKTIVIGDDDSTPGLVFVYVGTKQSTGNDVEKAGLFGGKLFGVKVDGMATEPNTAFSKAQRTVPFSLIEYTSPTLKTGSELKTIATGAGITFFNRPEDGAWNPSDLSEFFFVTTNGFGAATPCRLWRLKFKDITNPEAGGTLELMWDGSFDGDGTARMFDNMTINRTGQILINEDPGNQTYVARIHSFDIAKRTLKSIAIHNPTFFQTGSGSNFLTQDEESTGIIDASDVLGTPDTYLFNVQAHYAATAANSPTGANPAELVEGGQLLILAPSTRHTNMSTRGRVSATDPMISGFVISGNEPKTVLVRALGSSLANFGVSGAISNPRIQLFRGDEPIAENNDWKFNQNSAAITATGLAPFAASDSALLLTLQPGSYSVIAKDEAAASGVALIDVFEFDLKPGQTQSRIVNVSARGGVGTGDGVLIGGFAIEGREEKKVLLRALGPTLTGFGVSGVLSDPKLRLYRGSTLIASNDDWSQDAATAAVLNTSTLRPGSNVEPALVQTLAPGIYTVVIEGANASTGTALLDVTEL